MEWWNRTFPDRRRLLAIGGKPRMQMRGLTCWTLCLLATLSVSGHSGAETGPPNVLFIVIDDLNDWTGCLGGHPQARTPHIDSLAARGMLFTNAHCAAPACNPSRAAVFSGLSPDRTGVLSNRSALLSRQQPDLLLLPGAFRRAGYRVVGAGKLLHGPSGDSAAMLDEGFFPHQRWSPLSREAVAYSEEELPSKSSESPSHTVLRPGKDPVILPLNRMPSDRTPSQPNGESFDWGPFDIRDSEMGDGRITDWALDRMERGFDKPFFMAVGYYRPHIPLWAPAKYFDLYDDGSVQLPPYRSDDLNDLSDVAKNWAVEAVTAGSHATVVRFKQWRAAVRAYLACISFVDAQVGRLMKGLDQSPYSDRTLVVLWSDHGWHLGEKEHWGKWTGWQRSTRVPLIIVPPGKDASRFAAAGSKSSQPVSLLDLYPTLTDLAGVKPPRELDGHSLRPLIQAPLTATNRIVVTSFDRGNYALTGPEYRYIRYEDGSEELYDSRKDPNEWSNLAGDDAYGALLNRMRERLASHTARGSTGGP